MFIPWVVAAAKTKANQSTLWTIFFAYPFYFSDSFGSLSENNK